MEIEITNEAVLSHWSAVKNLVYISNERFSHIHSHHPDDFTYYAPFIAKAIRDPILILADHKNARTAMFVGRTHREGINVIVKLARLEDTEDRSFVVTMHPVGARSIKKLRKHNLVIYEACEF